MMQDHEHKTRYQMIFRVRCRVKLAAILSQAGKDVQIMQHYL